ncbi:MAG: DUF1080 domain-containing protein [Planctomycetota bacterium]
MVVTKGEENVERTLAILIRCSIVLAILVAGSVIAPSSAPAAAGTDTIMGDYVGTFEWGEGNAVPAEAKVLALGGSDYRVVLTAQTGVIGPVELSRDVEADRAAGTDHVTLKSAPGGSAWTGRIANGRLTAAAMPERSGTFDLLRIERHSPSEGLAPPPGAIVLLPFKGGVKSSLEAWTNKDWALLEDGSVQVTQGGNETVRPHGSGLFHIEFKVPYEPAGGGQGRGNSGVYFESRYEIQILDSFGLTPGMGDCGAIYGVAIPRVNACLPPLAWQTYDVIFRAPTKMAEGAFGPPTLTVFHNGILIHENQEVPHTTTAAPEDGHTARGPLYLQDHGHPVAFRNIWYLELAQP